jgi:hypothetical protein
MGLGFSSISNDLSAVREQTMQQMIDNQKNLQLKLRETQMAVQIGLMRDNFLWYSSFYALVAPICAIVGYARKNPAVFFPVLPLTFLLGFQYDLAYGYKALRVRREAEFILENERDLLLLPSNTAVVKSYEEYQKIFEKSSGPTE